MGARFAGGGGGFKVLPAMPLQEALLSETMRQLRAYWSGHCLALGRDTDPAWLRTALDHVVQASEALRAAFIPTALLGPALSILITPIFTTPARHIRPGGLRDASGVEWERIAGP